MFFPTDAGLIEGQAVQLEDGTTAYIQQVTEKGRHQTPNVSKFNMMNKILSGSWY